MLVKTYPWHNKLDTIWSELLLSKKFPPAILLTASDGIGRDILLKFQAEKLLCSSLNTDGNPCGVCHSCKLYAANNHPDLHVVEPVSIGKNIGIDQIRKLNENVWKSSQLNGNRVFLIAHADYMGEAAANALLKTLEEPPQNCYFLLYCTQLDRIIPTLKSRCNKWNLVVPPENEVKKWLTNQVDLANFTQLELSEIINLNAGAPLASLQHIQSNRQEKLQLLLDLFGKYIIADEPNLQMLTANICENYPNSLTWISYILSDLVKLSQNMDRYITLCNNQESLLQLAKKTNVFKLFEINKNLNLMQRQLLEHPGLNKEILIQEWLLQFC